MAETVILVEGTKVSQDGKRYKVVDAAEITGELVEVKVQKNRHAKLSCNDELCKVEQRKLGLKSQCRVSNLDKCQRHQIFPACGICGRPMTVHGTTTTL